MEDFLEKLVKVLEIQENCLTEIREDIFGMSQKVESQATAIKQLKP